MSDKREIERLRAENAELQRALALGGHVTRKLAEELVSRSGWPRTPAQIRDFIGSNFISRKDEKPAPEGSPTWAGEATENDVYTLSVHDLLSAFEWWADAQAADKEEA